MRRARPRRRYSGWVPTVDTPASGMARPLARMVNGMLEKLEASAPSTKAHSVHSGRMSSLMTFLAPSPKTPPKT